MCYHRLTIQCNIALYHRDGDLYALQAYSMTLNGNHSGLATAPTSSDILLILPEAFANDFLGKLGKANYQLAHVTTPEAAAQHLKSHTPEGIVALHRIQANLDWFEALRSGSPLPSRPVLLLVDEQPDASTSPADGIVTLESLNGTLSTLLQMRRDMAKLAEKNKALEQQVLALKANLDAERRRTGEVEILKTAIVRNVSHELRTPLVQVKAAVSLLAEDTKNAQLAEYATEATARLESLVRNVTQLGESLEPNRSPVLMREVTDYTLRSLRRVWDKRDRPDRIVVQIPQDLPAVFADKLGISTALMQLLDNALKFSQKSVTVQAELAENASCVRVGVLDQGIGIAPDKLEKIFELFFQVDGTSTRRYGGTGVGLALVKLILDNHETQIQVTSELGKGSTFWFTLPIVKI